MKIFGNIIPSTFKDWVKKKCKNNDTLKVYHFQSKDEGYIYKMQVIQNLRTKDIYVLDSEIQKDESVYNEHMVCITCAHSSGPLSENATFCQKVGQPMNKLDSCISWKAPTGE